MDSLIAHAFEDFHDCCLDDFDSAVLALKTSPNRVGIKLTAVPEPDQARRLISERFNREHEQQYRDADRLWPLGAEALLPIMAAPTLRGRRTILEADPVEVCYFALKHWPRDDDGKIADDGEFIDHMIGEIWKAAERYDPKNPRGAKFTTFLYKRPLFAVFDWHKAHAESDELDELPTWKPQQAPIEQLMAAILRPRSSSGTTLTKKQRAKIHAFEKARTAVVKRLLDAAGVSAVHRDACFYSSASVATKHNISVDAVYKWRERGRKKIAVVVERLKNGELSDLARALRKALATQWWEDGDGLRRGRGRQKPLRPIRAKAAIEPAPEDLTPDFTAEGEADWAKRDGFDTKED